MGRTNGLESSRLILREWKKEDYEPFAKLSADTKVMEYFPNILSKKESDDLADKLQRHISQKGWGIWVVEEKLSGNFIGFMGLHNIEDDLPFMPCVEIAWRLSYEYWGKGYATEAAKEVLRFAFEELELDEVVSFTAVINKRSEALMQRIGMKNTGKNFEHPAVVEGDRLREHVLYAIYNDKGNTRCLKH